jgi:hypothetical protein
MRMRSPVTRIITAAIGICTLAVAYGPDISVNLRMMLREHLKNPEFSAERPVARLTLSQAALGTALSRG